MQDFQCLLPHRNTGSEHFSSLFNSPSLSWRNEIKPESCSADGEKAAAGVGAGSDTAGTAFRLLLGRSREAFGFLDASSQLSMYPGSHLGLLDVQTLGAKTNRQTSLAAWVNSDTDFRSISMLQLPPSFTSIINHTQSKDWGRYLQGPVAGGVGGTTCSEPAQRSCVPQGTKQGSLHFALTLPHWTTRARGENSAPGSTSSTELSLDGQQPWWK